MYIKADIDELKKAKQELEKIKENCIKKYNKILELNNKLFCSWNGVDFIEYMNSFKNGNIGKVNKEVNKGLLLAIGRLDYTISEYEKAITDARNRMNRL